MTSIEQNPARTLAWEVAGNAQRVTLDRQQLVKFLESMSMTKLEIPAWNSKTLYPSTEDREALANYFLALNAINYCFFSQTPPYEPVSNGPFSGSSFAARGLTLHWDYLNRRGELARISEQFVKRVIFNVPPGVEPALLSERVLALNEVGRFLDQLYSGGTSLLAFIREESGGDALQFANQLPTLLPSWKDPYLKRAQLFVGMLYGRLRAENYEFFESSSLRKLTIFADYRTLQTLIRGNVVVPDRLLFEQIMNRHEIPAGSQEEQELRAMTIVAGDITLETLTKQRPDITPLEVDYLLWRSGRAEASSDQKQVPHHITVITSPRSGELSSL
jgi:hypothetical protein